jgi:hypothetical protein
MLTIAVKFVFLIPIVRNFHLTLPAFVDTILDLLPEKTFEWQFSEGPLSLDVTLGPSATTTPAPGSKEVKSVPVGTVVPVATTVDTANPVVTSVNGDTMDTPADPSSFGDGGGPLV